MQLYHITINNLRCRKMKMFFVLLGIIIGIATIVSVYSIVEGMKIEITKQVAEFGVNVIITPNAGGLTFSYGGIILPEIMYDLEKLTMEDVYKLQSINSQGMIKVLAPKLIGVKELHSNQQVIIVGGNLHDEFLSKPWMLLRDPQQQNFQIIEMINEKDTEGEKMYYEAIDLRRQDLKELNLADNEVILGASIASLLDKKEGDKINLANREFIVSGILLETGTAEDQQIFMNLPVVQEILERPDEITIIELVVDYTVGSEEILISEIKQVLPNVSVKSLRQETMRRDEMLGRVKNFGLAISVLVLLVGMLVVSLSISASVRERTREIGIFRAIGFRKVHIAGMIVMEGLVMSLLGGVAGYLGGMGLVSYIGPRFTSIDITKLWKIELVLISLGIALSIGLISSLYPAYQAANQDPAEALRYI